jgi:hypothetical protein
MASLVLSGDTSGTVTLAAPAVAGTQSYTLPTAVPAANGYALTSTTGGVLSWAAAGGSAATPTALGTVYGSSTAGPPYTTALGYQALSSITSAASNTAVGWQALTNNSTGANNTAVGVQALSFTTGSTNDAFGFRALYVNSTGTNNVAFGSSALLANTTGGSNTAVGTSALASNTTGSHNIAFGSSSLSSNTTASYNIAIGTNALTANTTGSSNVAVGSSAGPGYNYVLKANTTGTNNTAIGSSAMENNTTGSSNTAYGSQALWSNTTSSYNTVLGYQAGYSVTSQGNILLGYKAGYGTTPLTTGANNIHIGTETNPSGATVGNEIIIGYNGSTGKGTNTGFINPNSGGVYQGNNSAAWSVTSDQRLKKNIVDNTIGLAKINGIRVRNFEYRLPEEVDAELKTSDAIAKTGIQLGVIAQELQEILPDCVKQESTGVLSVDSDNLTWYLINAVKELSAKVASLESQLNGVQP